MSIESKSLDSPDEVRSFEKGRLQITRHGGVTIGRATFEPGWRWSECVKPIVGTDSCQASHTGYQVSGRLRVQMDDGTEREIAGGSSYHVPPGHDAWVVGDEPVVFVDFTGMTDYAKG